MTERLRRSFRLIPGVRINLRVDVTKSDSDSTGELAESKERRKESALNLLRGIVFVVALVGLVYIVVRRTLG
jgi:hypothetical protein